MAEAGTENKSLPKGVYRTSWGNAYFALIRMNGERKYSGTFETPEEAREWYVQACQLIGRDPG